MRRGELLGLKWDDIDFKKDCLYIRRAYVKVDAGFIFTDPKTAKSKRTVTLDAPTVAKLKSWKNQQSKEALAFPGEYNALNMVFTNEHGQPYSPDVISQRFKRDVKAAGVSDSSLHKFRHLHASLLLELDEGLKVVADRLGHSTITLTANTYGHISEEKQKQRQASNKVGAALTLAK